MSEPNLLELIINKDNTVTKSNLLIEAEYKLTPMEFKLIQTVFSNIQPGDTKTNTYVFPIKQFLDLLDLKGRSGYAELKRVTLELFKKPISITIDNQTSQLNWLTLVHYNDNKGTITIKINEFWEQYLFSLENNFTSYKLFNITNLKSAYSLRLYELLKSRVNLNSTRTILLKDLRAKMGISENQYPKYANFKQRVILQAQKELLAESDIYFEFVEIKKGRSIYKIEFQIFRNNQNEPVKQILNEAIAGESPLTVFGLTQKNIDELTSKFEQERILKNIEYVKEKIEISEVNNPAAYVKRAIEEDYAASIKKSTIKTSQKGELKTEQVKKLKGNREATEKQQFDLPIEEFEQHLLQVKELKEKVMSDESTIRDDIFNQVMDYQKYNERTHDSLISPSKFKDPYIQKICKDVIHDFYA